MDARWERQKKLNRIHLAIMLGQEPIGEIILKDLDAEKGTLSIHMKNDAFKNHGYGTRAEFLVLDLCITDLIKKPGAARSIIICVPKSDLLISLIL